MRFVNTICNKLEWYLPFKIGHNCSYFINEIKLFYLLCTCFDLNHNYTNRPGYLRPPILAVIKKKNIYKRNLRLPCSHSQPVVPGFPTWGLSWCTSAEGPCPLRWPWSSSWRWPWRCLTTSWRPRRTTSPELEKYSVKSHLKHGIGTNGVNVFTINRQVPHTHNRTDKLDESQIFGRHTDTLTDRRTLRWVDSVMDRYSVRCTDTCFSQMKWLCQSDQCL
jgi:hypothetical protein